MENEELEIKQEQPKKKVRLGLWLGIGIPSFILSFPFTTYGLFSYCYFVIDGISKVDPEAFYIVSAILTVGLILLVPGIVSMCMLRKERINNKKI